MMDELRILVPLMDDVGGILHLEGPASLAIHARASCPAPQARHSSSYPTEKADSPGSAFGLTWMARGPLSLPDT